MEKYTRPNSHSLEHCQGKKGENIGIANPENDHFLVIRPNLSKVNPENIDFGDSSQFFDYITNLNSGIIQE